MEVIAVAVGAGLVAGMLTGGLPGRLLDAPFRLLPLVLVAATGRIALDVAGDQMGDGAALAALLGSLVALAVFCVANIGVRAMPVVLLGVTLNGVVVALNGAMPIDLDAVGSDRERDRLAESPAYTADDGATLAVLGQTIPVPGPVHRPVSFGDLILAVGLAAVVYRACKAGEGVRTASRIARPGTHTVRIEGEVSGVTPRGDDASEREEDAPVGAPAVSHQV